MKNNMPTQPAYDMKIHPRENDLIVGTHGRGIYIADISPLAEVTSVVLDRDAFFFQPQSKIRWIASDMVNYASSNFNGESEPLAIPLYYYLKDGVTGDVAFTVYKGNVPIATLEGPGEAGIHQVQWGMNKQPQPVPEEQAQAAQAGGRPGAQARGEPAPLGEYRVVMTVDGRTVGERTVSILKDEWWMERR